VSMDFRTLRAAFNRAVKLKMIESNPFAACEDVRIAMVKPYSLSKVEAEVLLKGIPRGWLRDVVVIALCTGMRLGEIVHLKWEDVDFARECINLENSGEFLLKTRKPRTIPLNKIALEVLKRLFHQGPLVFTDAQGNSLDERRVSRKFKEHVRRAGLSEKIHFHTLRHTGASWLVQSGVPLSFVKEILGHSSIQTTMIYAHSTMDHLRESVSRLDSYILN
jgi:integrase